jgi:uncharacterized membrane protein YoaK (UPF0700 family)
MRARAASARARGARETNPPAFTTIYKICLVIILPKINFQNFALLLLYQTFVTSFGISVKECKFTEIFIWHVPTTAALKLHLY